MSGGDLVTTTQRSPLSPTTLNLSGERLVVDYSISGPRGRAQAVVDQLVVEQTIEFPLELVPDDDIRAHIVGQVLSFDETAAETFSTRISFAVEIVGGQLPQLLNVLFGNISMVPGVKVAAVELPDSLLANFDGPRHGISGLRERLARPRGPILATALKPMGTPIEALAAMAYEFASNGIDLIKDDHSFATQPFCLFRERVSSIARSVAKANDEGRSAVYLPALNVPVHELSAAAEFAVEVGAGGLLVLPGLFGFDTMRWLAESTPASTVIMAHPAMLGALVTKPDAGIGHGLLFGTMARLAGADLSIFPNHGGRFTFDPADCLAISEACTEPRGDLRPIFPVPAGGMTVEKVPEMIEFYGSDVCLLIGGGLYRGDIATQVRCMVDALEREEC